LVWATAAPELSKNSGRKPVLSRLLAPPYSKATPTILSLRRKHLITPASQVTVNPDVVRSSDLPLDALVWQRRMESQGRGVSGVFARKPSQPARRRVLRRPTTVLTTAVLGTALMVPDLPAQQLPPTGASAAAGAPSPVTSTMLARGARYLLRNGW